MPAWSPFAIYWESMVQAMKLEYKGGRISGILTVIPKNMKTFDEEMDNYQASKARTKRLKAVMGYDRHHFVTEDTCTSDLTVFALDNLLQTGKLEKNDIGALILITQSPDYFMPATSNVIQGRLGLSHDVYCLDINQGCAGFIIGLQQAFSLLPQLGGKKAIIVNGDVLSRKVSKQDRNSWPLSGDAASVTIVEKGGDDNIYGIIKMDGSRYDALIIPAGGFRQPSTPETAVLHDDGEGNLRSADNLCMQGGAVFNFMQTEVPPLIEETLAIAGKSKAEIDWYMFHQPNKFMVDKLADAMGVPHEKMPSNIVTYFGNASGITIPTNICYNLGEKLLTDEYSICLSGFGVGLTWGAMVLKMGKLDFCEMAEY